MKKESWNSPRIRWELDRLSYSVGDPENDPERMYRVTEIKERLTAAIQRLPEREKIVIGLYYYEGLTLKEVGEVLGVAASWVSRLRTRAEGRLIGRLVWEGLLPAGPE